MLEILGEKFGTKTKEAIRKLASQVDIDGNKEIAKQEAEKERAKVQRIRVATDKLGKVEE